MSRTLRHWNDFSVLSALSLATTLTLAGLAGVGCGSNHSGGSSSQDSGPIDTGVLDAGQDTATNDTGTGNDAEAGFIDTMSEPIEQTLDSPTFAPPDGTSFVGTGSVQINPPVGFPNDGTIYFTVDGTLPTTASPAYVGAIQVSASETIFAMAAAPGYDNSPPVHASYTVTPPEGGPGPADPVISPVSTKANNDFLASISDSDASVTICYRLDGTLPTCNSNGKCGSGSSTYNGGSLIAINGSLTPPTNPPTGAVTLTAIACDSAGTVADCSGGPNGAGCEADYVLQVADPFMTNPPQGTDLLNGGSASIQWGSAALPSGAAGISPSLTTNTESTNYAVSIWYQTAPPGQGATASCITGTAGTNPTIFNGTTGQPAAINSSSAISAMACKQGYKPSSSTTFTYNLSLSQPGLPIGGTYTYQPQIYAPGVGPTTALHAIDTANAGSGDLLCYTAGPVPTPAASCGTNGGCGQGSDQLSAPPGNAPLAVGNTTSPSTIVSIVACPALGVILGTQPPVATTYTLRYAQLFASSTDPFGTDQNLPGWGDTATGNGEPNTSFSLPSGAANTNGYPVSDHCTGAGADVNGDCMWQIGIVEPLPGCVNTEFGCSASPLNLNPAYYCFSTQRGAGALACGTTSNACKSANTTTVSFSGSPLPAPQNLVNGTGAAVGAVWVTGGAQPDTLTLIACPDVVTAGVTVVEASFQTDIGPAGKAGAATAPQATPSGGLQTAQAVVTLTNEDATASVICFTTDGSNPGCNFAAGVASCTGATTYCGQNTPATATAPAPPLPVATLPAVNCSTSIATTTIAFGSSVTIPAIQDLTANSGIEKYLQVDGTSGGTLKAIACNGVESASAFATTTPYTFALATPDFGSTPQPSLATCQGQTTSCAGSNNLDTAPAAVGVGTPVYITDTSNFDWDLPATLPITIHWAWGGQANCGTVAGACPGGTINGLCGSAAPSAYVANESGNVFAEWPATLTTTVPAPPTGNTVTLTAIACAQTTNLEANSALQSVTYTVQAATPVLVTDQSCLDPLGTAPAGGATTCGTSTCTNMVYASGAWVAPNTAQKAEAALLSGNNGCPVATGSNPNVSNWDNPIQVVVVGPTPGSATSSSYLCVSTIGQPKCSSGSGCSSGATQLIDVSGAGNLSAVITIDGKTTATLSGTTVYASACTGTLPEVDMVPVTFNLISSPIDFVNPAAPTMSLPSGSTVACGITNGGASAGTAVNSVQMQQDATNPTYQAGGPSLHQCLCYTLDGSPVNLSTCSAPTTASCLAVSSGSTHCGDLVNGTSNVLLPIDGPAGITYSTCVLNAAFTLSQSSGTTSYKVTPYTHTITVDGNVSDWYIGGQNEVGNTSPESFQATNGGGTALVTYDANDLYLGFVDATYAGAATYTAAAGFAVGGSSAPAIGLLIGNGAATASSAPQALPTAANFNTTPGITLPQSEGALYFLLWPTGGTAITAYSWNGTAWVAATGITPTVKTGSTSLPGLASPATGFELSIPFSSLPLLTTATTQLTVQGIYVTGYGTAGPTQVFTWAKSSSATADDGWFNDFTNSCVAPAFVDLAAPTTINANPGQ